MGMDVVPGFVYEALDSLGIEADAALPQKQAQFLDLLLETNRRFNLTGVRDRDAAWRRHVIDSLTLLPLLEGQPAGSRIIDVGSGGGLPGIPLAIARPDLRIVLLEATGKKARFLEAAAEALGLSHCNVINARAEALGQDVAHRQRYDAVLCRAIGPMREILEYTLPLARVEGRVLSIKGRGAEAELRTATRAMDTLGAGPIQIYNAYPESFGHEGVIVVIEKARPTPPDYPRIAGMPRHAPL